MSRVLTKSEINQLYEFVAVKDIPHYDVQSEIVDHLASMMEDRWAGGSKLGLEQMFLEVYKEFGEPEWKQIFVTRQKAAWRQLWFQAKENLARCFRLPLFLLLLLAVLLVQQMMQVLPEQLEILFYAPLVVQAALLIFTWVTYFIKLPANRYLMSDTYMQMFALDFWGAFLSLKLLYRLTEQVNWNHWLFALAFVALVLILIVIPSWVRIAGLRRSIARHHRLMKRN